MRRSLTLIALVVGVGAGGSCFAQQYGASPTGSRTVALGTAWERPVIGAVGPNGANQCFARARIPAEVEVTTVERTVQPARQETRMLPAIYENLTREEIIEPARVEYVVRPGVYRTVTATVQTAGARTETVVVPPRYERVSQRVLVSPAYVTWRPGCATYGFSTQIRANTDLAGGPDEQILCRVESPPRYETIVRDRLVEPARPETRTIPAQQSVVTRQELVTPARVEMRTIPAKTRRVQDRRLVQPVRTEVVTLPPVIAKEQQTRVLRPERMEWREVLCEGESAAGKIRDVQRALRTRGHRISVDGQFGPQTLAAIERFQRDNKLATGYLTVETMQALGVSPY